MTETHPTQMAPLVLRWVARLVLLVLALLVGAAIVVVVIIPRMTQGAALTVLTGSMTPDIPVGSVVVVRPVDPQTLQVGDIATYQAQPDSPALITHRITQVKQTSQGLRFIFKGDANRSRDLDPVVPQQIRGEVWFHVPYLGSIRDGLHGKGGITLVVMILLAGYALTQISSGLRERRRPESENDAGSSEQTLTIDRALVVARLAHAPGTMPGDLARGWGGLVIEDDETGFTLMIAPPVDALAATLELLQEHTPIDLRVWDAPATLSGTSVSIRRAASELEETPHAVG